MNDKARKKALLKTWQAEVQRRFEASLPMTKLQFATLFDALDQILETHDCDHTNQHTRNILRTMKLPNIEIVITWLQEYGGYCDCEVLWNVEDHFQ